MTGQECKSMHSGVARLLGLVVLPAAIVVIPMIAHTQTDSDRQQYSVTITNVTKGQRISAPLVWSHNAMVTFFEVGMPASQALQSSAEAGNPGLLATVFVRSSDVDDVVRSIEGLLTPGDSVTLTVEAGGAFNLISFVSMLNPTNDAFVAVQGMKIPKAGKSRVAYVPAYDAGSEINDELCASIPGGFCDGEGRSREDGEGFVHVHAGIRGVGDLDPEQYDWRNPVARVEIRLSD